MKPEKFENQLISWYSVYVSTCLRLKKKDSIFFEKCNPFVSEALNVMRFMEAMRVTESIRFMEAMSFTETMRLTEAMRVTEAMGAGP